MYWRGAEQGAPCPVVTIDEIESLPPEQVESLRREKAASYDQWEEAFREEKGMSYQDFMQWKIEGKTWCKKEWME